MPTLFSDPSRRALSPPTPTRGPPAPASVAPTLEHDDGIVTARGSFGDGLSAVQLRLALRPYQQLDRPVVVDLRRAVLGDGAVSALVEVGLRCSMSTGGFSVLVVHADATTRQQFGRAGGALLLQTAGPGRESPTGSRDWGGLRQW